MEEVSEGANHVGGREEPRDHTGEQTRHPNQQQDTEGLKGSDQLSMLVLGRYIFQTSARVSLLRVEIENETSQGIF